VRAARTRTALALASLAAGDFATAEAELGRALPVLRASLPPTHPDLADALAIAFNLHHDRGEWGPAAAASVALIDVHRARGDAIPFVLLHNAGYNTLRSGDPVAAIPWLDQALAVAASQDPQDPSDLAHALNGRALAHLAQRQPVLARALLDRTRPLLARIDPPVVALVAEVLWGSAQALAAGDRGRDEARALATEARAAYVAVDPASPELAAIDAFLADRGAHRSPISTSSP